MLNISLKFQSVISAFSELFTKPTWKKASELLWGAILCPGSRTVCNVLRTLGYQDSGEYYKFHRVLSRAVWSPLKLSQVLVTKLINTFIDPDEALVCGVDETIERRWGAQIEQRGIYRDAVRSSKSHVVKCSGLRWMSVMLLTPLPWLEKGVRWALPFLTMLCPSSRYYENKPSARVPKKLTDWARQLLFWLNRYVKPLKANVCLVGDGSYATYELMQTAQRVAVPLISRLKFNARLFHPPKPKPVGRRGPQPGKGGRILNMNRRLTDGRIKWSEVVIPRWYHQIDKKLRYTTGVSVWDGTGAGQRVTIRWILVTDPTEEFEPALIGVSDPDLPAHKVIDYAAARWGVEVTFAEGRRHLGMETQRQWSPLAIARTTPVLLALKSIVCLLAKPLYEQGKLINNAAAWYEKTHYTFSDILASVRSELWPTVKLSGRVSEALIDSLRERYTFMRRALILAVA